MDRMGLAGGVRESDNGGAAQAPIQQSLSRFQFWINIENCVMNSTIYHELEIGNADSKRVKWVENFKCRPKSTDILYSVHSGA